ncbi:MAG: tetratricopeptide repeat protein [Fusobacterium sp.]|uniref:tetratricopeptide repeat protein n=1 Tax=Fusobacterium sp. TaxID=68766 RepID=UPI002A74AA91|nr:tetratricopeptide repeat protein [Fusobacterium sp.]MDY2981661.1 tetratricopeptide repeat protein [Fusobacterium sp.]
MKNKKYIWIGFFVLSILLLTYSYKDIKLYYYVKMGNKNYYSKNYEKAVEYYEKALKIKEDYNIRINLIITDYQMKNYKKVLESPVENGFLKGNSLVFMSEKNQNNIENLKKSLEYYKEDILTNDDINIKKNYEIIESRLKEQQNQDNNQQENKDKKQNQNSDSEKDKNNNDNQQNNQSQDNKNQQQNNNDNQRQDNKDSQNNDEQNQDQNKNNQSNQNSNDNQNDLDRNNNEQNNSQENLDNSNKEKSKNNDQEKNQNSNSENEKENNKNSNYQNSSLNKPQQTKQQKELQLMLKNLVKNEKQSFKNNERLIGVENESDTKNRW